MTTLSMPDPCSHFTRVDAIRARLHGDAEVLEHLDRCDDLRPCYLCPNAGPGKEIMRKVLSEFTTPGSDPTAAYHLSCGHSVIDL